MDKGRGSAQAPGQAGLAGDREKSEVEGALLGEGSLQEVRGPHTAAGGRGSQGQLPGGTEN